MRYPTTVSRRSCRYFRRVALLFILSLTLSTALLGDRGFLAYLEARRVEQTLRQEVARLRRENRVLSWWATRLRHDPATIREIARRELGLIEPGEVVFVVAPNRCEDVLPGRPVEGC